MRKKRHENLRNFLPLVPDSVGSKLTNSCMLSLFKDRLSKIISGQKIMEVDIKSSNVSERGGGNLQLCKRNERNEMISLRNKL